MPSFYAQDFLREFHLALIVGNIGASVLWEPNRWPEFIACLEPLVGAARGPAASSGCYARQSAKRLELVNFKSRNWREVVGIQGTFTNWGLLAPSDATCVRQKRTPDVYAFVSNLSLLVMNDLRFNPAITLAIGVDVLDSPALMDAAVERIASLTSAVMVAKKVRTWGLPTEIGYNSGIGETSWFVGGLSGRQPSAEILSEKWDQVSICDKNE